MRGYAWPSSGITEQDMRLLYHARKSQPVKTPITELIARAVRQTYGNVEVANEDKKTADKAA